MTEFKEMTYAIAGEVTLKNVDASDKPTKLNADEHLPKQPQVPAILINKYPRASGIHVRRLMDIITYNYPPRRILSRAELLKQQHQNLLSSIDIHSKITLVIGPNKCSVKLGERRLCEVSDFLLSAVCDRWECGCRGKISFPTDDPNDWCLFVAWLNTGDFKSAPDLIMCDTLNKAKKKEQCAKQFEQLLASYLLGHRLEVYEFKNKVMGFLIENLRHSHLEASVLPASSKNALDRIYDTTAPDSPLRRYVVHGCYAIAGPEAINQFLAEHNEFPQFNEDLVKFAFSIPYGEKLLSPYQRDPCDYHDHSNEDGPFRCST